MVDRATIDVRFYERGAGFTMSSGTGSTGAFFAAYSRGLIDAHATVETLAGPLVFRIEDASVLMQGPAEIEGDEIGDIDQRRNRPQPDGAQPRL